MANESDEVNELETWYSNNKDVQNHIYEPEKNEDEEESDYYEEIPEITNCYDEEIDKPHLMREIFDKALKITNNERDKYNIHKMLLFYLQKDHEPCSDVVREHFEIAIKDMKSADFAQKLCQQYAIMETVEENFENARQLLNYCCQYPNVVDDIEFWMNFENFEFTNGTEDTRKAMNETKLGIAVNSADDVEKPRLLLPYEKRVADEQEAIRVSNAQVLTSSQESSESVPAESCSEAMTTTTNKNNAPNTTLIIDPSITDKLPSNTTPSINQCTSNLPSNTIPGIDQSTNTNLPSNTTLSIDQSTSNNLQSNTTPSIDQCTGNLPSDTIPGSDQSTNNNLPSNTIPSIDQCTSNLPSTTIADTNLPSNTTLSIEQSTSNNLQSNTTPSIDQCTSNLPSNKIPGSDQSPNNNLPSNTTPSIDQCTSNLPSNTTSGIGQAVDINLLLTQTNTQQSIYTINAEKLQKSETAEVDSPSKDIVQITPIPQKVPVVLNLVDHIQTESAADIERSESIATAEANECQLNIASSVDQLRESYTIESKNVVENFNNCQKPQANKSIKSDHTRAAQIINNVDETVAVSTSSTKDGQPRINCTPSTYFLPIATDTQNRYFGRSSFSDHSLEPTFQFAQWKQNASSSLPFDSLHQTNSSRSFIFSVAMQNNVFSQTRNNSYLRPEFRDYTTFMDETQKTLSNQAFSIDGVRTIKLYRTISN